MRDATRVGIVCALTAEARHLSRAGGSHAPTVPTPITTLADGTLLIVSGMGSHAASAAARTLVDAGAHALLSFGLAGGLDPAFRPGSLFLPSSVRVYDPLDHPGDRPGSTPPGHAAGFRPRAVVAPDALRHPPIQTPAHDITIHDATAANLSIRDPTLPTDPTWRERLNTALALHHPVSQGTLITAHRAIATTAAKADLFRATAAAAVDMECFAVANVALQSQIPFVALKVIVDGAHDSLPRCALTATDITGHVHLWPLIAALVRTPSDLAPLLTVARRYRTASKTLAAAARTLVAPPLDGSVGHDGTGTSAGHGRGTATIMTGSATTKPTANAAKSAAGPNSGAQPPSPS